MHNGTKAKVQQKHGRSYGNKPVGSVFRSHFCAAGMPCKICELRGLAHKKRSTETPAAAAVVEAAIAHNADAVRDSIAPFEDDPKTATRRPSKCEPFQLHANKTRSGAQQDRATRVAQQVEQTCLIGLTSTLQQRTRVPTWTQQIRTQRRCFLFIAGFSLGLLHFGFWIEQFDWNPFFREQAAFR